MLSANALTTFISYQIRRSLARKRLLILIASIFLLEIAIYLVLTRLPETLIRPLAGYAWVVGVLAPSTALIHVLALMVGATTSAEEYEVGTADYWLTRPITRLEYFVGNLAGGLTFLSTLILLYSFFAAAISSYVFGPQTGLDVLPATVLSTIASVLVFYSLGLMVGELLRRSMLSTILSGMVFFGSFIAETYLNIVSTINNDPSLLDYVRYLPTWGAVRLASTTTFNGLGAQSISSVFLQFFTTLGRTGETAALLTNIAAYTAISLAAAWMRLRYTDVTRKSV
jgi:ABC-2 type transport system permease protein